MRASLFALPIVLVGMVQLSGCTNTPAAVPPPPAGGVYRSESAGALFEQSVKLATPPATGADHIARFVLKGAHRPNFNTQAIYSAAGANGYVVSEDDGHTWQTVAVPLTAVLDIVALEKNIVVVTGIDGEGQGYILRSADEGRSWQTVLTVPVPAKSNRLEIISVGKQAEAASVVISIVPDPFEPNRLYAGTSLGNIFVGEQFAKTWHKIHNVDNDAFSSNQTAFAVADVVPSPHRPGDLLIITTGGKLYSVDAAGNQTAIKIPEHVNDGPIISLGQSKTVLSATFVGQFPDALLVGVNDGAVLSRDRGVTWEQLSLPVDTIKRFNSVAVTVSPTNPNRILIAINDAVYRSEDGGGSWNTFSLSLPAHIITSLLINPTNPASVLAITTPLPS